VRTIVIGDVHGCLEEFLDLLVKVGHRPHEDRVILLGDLMDRGPHPVALVRLVAAMGFDCVASNHDMKHVQYAEREKQFRETGRPNGMRPFTGERLAQHLELTSEDLAFLAARPGYLRFEAGGRTWLTVHAGIPTDKPLELVLTKVEALTRTRYVHRDGRQCGSEPAPGDLFWTDCWKGPQSVLYGHNVHSLEAPLVTLRKGVVTIGMDTGCVFGGHLSAAVFDGDGLPEIVQVKAAREYFPMHRSREG
jgi:hypothetical protein